jgi:hypothetical protein
LVRYSIVAGATFSPAALHHDVRLTFFSPKAGSCGASAPGGYDSGNNHHASALHQAAFAACKGERLVAVAKWHAYATKDDQSAFGDATSSVAFQVPRPEPAPRLSWQEKQRLAQLSQQASLVCVIGAAGGIAVALAVPPVAIVIGVLAYVSCAQGAYALNLSRDPVDTNFRAIAKPQTPPVPKVASGEGVSASAAAVVNRLLALQAKQLGLARAILTAFNRSQGAHVKKQTAWEKKQVRAAGQYAAQLSELMISEAKLRPSVRRAFSGPIVVSEDQAYEFQESLVFDGRLPPRVVSGLTRLGLTKAEQAEIHGQLAAGLHPTQYDGDAIAAIAKPQFLALLRRVAADLKAFSKRAARDPLTTGQ